MGRAWLFCSTCLLLVAAAAGSSPYPLANATNICDVALFASTAGQDDINDVVSFVSKFAVDLRTAIVSRLPSGNATGAGRTPQQQADLQTLLDLALPSLAALINTKTGGIAAEGLLEKGEIDLDQVVAAKSVDDFLSIVKNSPIDVDTAIDAVSGALSDAMDFGSITLGSVAQDAATSLEAALGQLLKLHAEGRPLIVKELKPEYLAAAKKFHTMLANQLANKGGIKRALDWVSDTLMSLVPQVMKFFQGSREAERALGTDARKMVDDVMAAVKARCSNATSEWGRCQNLKAMLERLNVMGGTELRYTDCNCKKACMWTWPNGTCGADQMCVNMLPTGECTSYIPYVNCDSYSFCFVRCGAVKPPYGGYSLYGPCVSDNKTNVVITYQTFAGATMENWHMTNEYYNLFVFLQQTAMQAAVLFVGDTFVEDADRGMALLKAAVPEMAAPFVAAFSSARDSRAAWWIARIARQYLLPLRGSALAPASVAVSFLREMCRAGKGNSTFGAGALLDARIPELAAASGDALVSKVTGEVNLPDLTLRLLTDQREDLIKRAVAEFAQTLDARAMSWDIRLIPPVQDMRQQGVLLKYWMLLDPTVATNFSSNAMAALPSFLHKYLPNAEVNTKPIVGPTKPRKDFK